jgi:uncharacterized protein (TIGR00369 family)
MPMTAHFRKLENMYLSAPLNNQVYSQVTISITEGRAEISQLIQDKFFHAAGSLHGSVYFKLLDDSAYFAANSLVTDYFLYTTSFQIQILKPLKEGIIRAEGIVIKPGASVIIAESRLYDQRNKLAAIGQGQFMKSAITFSEIEGYKT